MKKPYDRVTEAYNDKLGYEFGRKTRERVHWICEQAHGTRILDVGCSQGITSILLGREGKQSLGIDLLEKSITYAKSQLELEEQMTKDNVEFVQSNFINYNFQDEKFDTIIFGEILEHISDPYPFMMKAKRLLKENGRIIVTVPFGINDYFDHKKTYYLTDLLGFQDNDIQVYSIKFLGKWIGAIFKKDFTNENQFKLNEELIKELEQQFKQIERDYISDKLKQKQLINSMEDQLALKNESFEKKKKQIQNSLQNQVEQLRNDKSDIEKRNKRNEDTLKTFEIESAVLKTEIKALTNEVEQYKSQMKTNESVIVDFTNENQVLKEKISVYEDNKVNLELKITRLIEKNRSINEDYEITIEEQNKKIADLHEKVNLLEDKELDNDQIIDEQKESEKLRAELTKVKKKENQTKEILEKQKTQFNKELRGLKARHSLILKERIHLKEQLYEAYTKEERLLKSYSKLLKRYKALSESKLGRLTLAYWEKRTQKRNKAKRR